MATTTVRPPLPRELHLLIRNNAGETCAIMSEAEATLESRLMHLQGDLARGAFDLVQVAGSHLADAAENPSTDAFDAASCKLGIAIAVVDVLADKSEDLVVWGVLRLLSAAREHLNGTVLSQPILGQLFAAEREMQHA